MVRSRSYATRSLLYKMATITQCRTQETAAPLKTCQAARKRCAVGRMAIVSAGGTMLLSKGRGTQPPSGPPFPLLCGRAPTSLPRTDYIRVRLFRAPPPASPKWAATRPRPENIIPNRTIPPRRRLATRIGAERASIQSSRPRRLACDHRRGLCLFFLPLCPGCRLFLSTNGAEV